MRMHTIAKLNVLRRNRMNQVFRLNVLNKQIKDANQFVDDPRAKCATEILTSYFECTLCEISAKWRLKIKTERLKSFRKMTWLKYVVRAKYFCLRKVSSFWKKNTHSIGCINLVTTENRINDATSNVYNPIQILFTPQIIFGCGFKEFLVFVHTEKMCWFWRLAS